MPSGSLPVKLESLLLLLCVSFLHIPAANSYLSPCFSPHLPRPRNTRTATYMFANIMEGGRERVPFLEQFVAERNHTLAVIGLSEINGWQADDLAQFGKKFGFLHSVFVHAPTGYHLGAISKVPITMLHSTSGLPMHHGVAIFQTADGTVIVLTHLSPRHSDARVAEATYIVRQLGACCEHLPILVCKSLNEQEGIRNKEAQKNSFAQLECSAKNFISLHIILISIKTLRTKASCPHRLA